jgi:MFS superfamily sulfate permease-like transporter
MSVENTQGNDAAAATIGFTLLAVGVLVGIIVAFVWHVSKRIKQKRKPLITLRNVTLLEPAKLERTPSGRMMIEHPEELLAT